MRIKYDSARDVVRIYLSDSKISESDEVAGGVIIDYDASENIIAIEILDASKRVGELEKFAVEFVKV